MDDESKVALLLLIGFGCALAEIIRLAIYLGNHLTWV